MILYDPEEIEEEFEDEEIEELSEPPKKVKKRWKFSAPVIEALKERRELEGAEEEGEEEDEGEELERKELGFKLATPTVTVEIQISGGKSEEILKELRETFSFVLRTAKKEGLL